MSATDMITVGDQLPRVAAVSPREGYAVAVTWASPAEGVTRVVVDLAPLILRLKFYAPLRSDPDLMSSVHVINGGSAIAWGADDQIDMAATSVSRLVEVAATGAALAAAN